MQFLGGQFHPESGGQFEMETGGQFQMDLGGQFAWIFQSVILVMYLKFKSFGF
jgi:hypothetical protein